MVAPLFGVLDAQERDAVEPVVVTTVRLPGAVGALATVTIAVAVDVPLPFVAVRV
jgi:hypothetical protein